MLSYASSCAVRAVRDDACACACAGWSNRRSPLPPRSSVRHVGISAVGCRLSSRCVTQPGLMRHCFRVIVIVL